MAVWAIGDIQGCYESFLRLLDAIDFDATCDELWLVGDLVNRGPDGLDVLRFCLEHHTRIKAVLGNHDITLLAAYWGLKPSNPTIDPILQAPDANELIAWVRTRPFLHTDLTLGYAMAHAGISPEFDLGTAVEYARRIERKLQSDDAPLWLERMFKHGENRFDRQAGPEDIDRYILSSFTRMRYCRKEDKRLDFKQKGAPTPEVRDKDLVPWFECLHRAKVDARIVFGHWSTLGLYRDEHVVAIDTGCVWGGKLTAVRLDDASERVVQVACEGAQNPTNPSV